MTAVASTHEFRSFDGVKIAWSELGQGRAAILLHGLFSNAEVNWLRRGAATVLAQAGIRAIMPDFRAHGRSEAPGDAAAYPPDVLALDIERLVAHLALDDFDLAGYSLGARTTVRLVVRGLRPRRVVLAGMGLDGVVNFDGRTRYFLRVIESREPGTPGSPEWLAGQFMKSNGIDPEAAAHVLRSQVQIGREELSAIAMPALVVCGTDDDDTGSGLELARALPSARYVAVPGNHMTAVTKPEFANAIADFLAVSE
ncbi:MAG: alpha/beta fold hydrolase [Candidatus Binatia bacterium]